MTKMKKKKEIQLVLFIAIHYGNEKFSFEL